MSVEPSWRIGQDDNTYDEITDAEFIRQLNRLTEEIGPELVLDTRLQAIADAYIVYVDDPTEQTSQAVDDLLDALTEENKT